METAFTPFSSFGGGLAIGLGAVLLMLGLGRILGATGVLTGLVFADNRDELSWRVACGDGRWHDRSTGCDLCTDRHHNG